MNLSKFILFTFTLIMFSTNSLAYGVKLAKGISKKHIKIINNDLKVLEKYNYTSSFAKTDILKVLGLKKLTNKNMVRWLEDRVQVVIPQTPFNEMDITVSQENFHFPYSGKTDWPKLELISFLDKFMKIKATRVMSNVGTAIYYSGKRDNKLYQINIKARGLKKQHLVTSPRTGIIMIGDGHFMDRFDVVKGNKNALPNSLHRLSTFFHEARHSDGHGKSLGFFHAKCPKGHDFEYLNACDRNLNGPYTVGALVKREFIRNCKSCSLAEKEALKISYLDSLNRVIKVSRKNHRVIGEELDKLMRIRKTLITIINSGIYSGDKLKDFEKNLALTNKMILELKRKGIRHKDIPSGFWNPAPEGKRS